MSYKTRLPVHNYYKTPNTLGTDRLANLVGARSLFPGKNILIISAGTCITYDVITSSDEYYGGNITPGIDMRLKAMHTFTSRLPLIKKEMKSQLYGDSTATAMLTGTLQGTALEVTGFIQTYRKEYRALRIVLTGGDAPLIENILSKQAYRKESKIFAVPHLTLHGLNEILLLHGG